MNTDLQERLDKIDQIRADLKAAEQSATKDIMSMLKDLMAANPLLVGLRWQQYTPGFNDGEPCLFTVNGPQIKFDDSLAILESDTEDYYDDYQLEGFFKKRVDVLNHVEFAALKKAVDDATTVWGKLSEMEDELQDMFGDGTQIIVTKDGVETEEHDCGY